MDQSMQALVEEISALRREVSEQTALLADLSQATTGAENRPSTYPFEASTTVTKNTPVTSPIQTTIEIPYDCTITRILIGFPAGTQQAVGVKVGKVGGEALVPRGGVNNATYTAFDDRVIETEPNEELTADTPLEAEFVNSDPNNDHFINVLVFAEER